MVKIFISLNLLLLISLLLQGQCPSKQDLQSSIRSMADSLRIPTQQKIEGLLRVEEQLKTCGYSKDSLHVFLLHKLSRTCASDSSFTEAIDYARKSIRLIEENPSDRAINPHDLLLCFFDLYTYYAALGLDKFKNAAIDSCILHSARMNFGDQYSLYLLYYKILTLVDAGDYHQVLSYAKLGESISSGIITEPNALYYLLTCRDFQAEAYIAIGDFELAEKILSQIVDKRTYYAKSYDLGTVYEHLAEVMAHKGELKSAEELFNLSLQNYLSTKNFLQCSIIAGNIGLVLYGRGKENSDAALRYYRKAIWFTDLARSASKGNNIGGIIAEKLNLLVNIANVKVSMKQFDSAFYYFQLAFNELGLNANESTILHSPSSEFEGYQKIGYIIELVIDKGDAFLAEFTHTGNRQSLNNAVSTFKVADSILNRVKFSQSDAQSRLFWRLSSRRLYENAIRASWLNAENENGYYFFERSRAVLLNDELVLKEKSSESDLLKQADLKRKISAVERKLELEGDSSDARRALENQLFTLRREQETIGHVTKGKGLSFLTQIDASGTINLNQLQKGMLQDLDGLVEFFVGDSNVYVFVSTRQHAEIKLINRNKFVTLRDQYISYLDNPILMNRNFDAFIKVARDLYQFVFENTLIRPGRIVISPDGRNFPFESLVTSKANEPLRYFVEDYAICYSYSSRYFMHDFENSIGTPKMEFLGMAPIVFPVTTHLPSLLGSDISLEQINRNFGNSSLAIGKEATRNAFMSDYFNYRIIHLYTHASDSSNRGEPVIYFADSTVYLSELISENSSSTKLIVLAACETAGGKLYQGEGVFSFNRGFAALGIPACISNLWSVDDATTYELSQSFYNYLSKGLPTDVSLQKAKIDFLKNAQGEKKLPSYWAATILAGKTDQFNVNKGINLKALAAMIGLPLFAMGIWYALVRRRKGSTPSPGKERIVA